MTDNTPLPPDKATRRKMVKQFRAYALTQPYAGTKYEDTIAEAIMGGFIVIDMKTMRYEKTTTGVAATLLGNALKQGSNGTLH